MCIRFDNVLCTMNLLREYAVHIYTHIQGDSEGNILGNNKGILVYYTSSLTQLYYLLY